MKTNCINEQESWHKEAVDRLDCMDCCGDTKTDPIEDALRSAIDWHHGDKWRNSKTKGHKLAWEIHNTRLTLALKLYKAKKENI